MLLIYGAHRLDPLMDVKSADPIHFLWRAGGPAAWCTVATAQPQLNANEVCPAESSRELCIKIHQNAVNQVSGSSLGVIPRSPLDVCPAGMRLMAKCLTLISLEMLH